MRTHQGVFNFTPELLREAIARLREKWSAETKPVPLSDIIETLEGLDPEIADLL